jgi:dienelactone hydrolase
MNPMRSYRFLLLLAALASGSTLMAIDSPPAGAGGTIEVVPAATESAVPQPFRLAPATFAFQMRSLPTVSPHLTISTVSFPSPLVTPHENNNTVHCEYFSPKTEGPKAGVIVLHILGGDFDLARLFARALASRGVAALFLKMPYYGERRQPDSQARMISLDPHETVRGMSQAVLDIRRAAAWLAAQKDIDPGRLGIMGISLGGITAALSASVEPRFSSVCLILAGGDMGEVAWQSSEMAPLRDRWLAGGGTRESLCAILKQVDPVTYARPVAGRRVLMLNAKQDEVIPPACTTALWKSLGEPEIVWWDAGHYTAVRYLFDGLARAVDFFASSPKPKP